MKAINVKYAWAIQWRSNNSLDGETVHLMGRFNRHNQELPAWAQGLSTMLFATRDEARRYIRNHYGYIRHRPDLRKSRMAGVCQSP